MHQNSSANVARRGHLDAAVVLAHGSSQRPIGRWSRWTELYIALKYFLIFLIIMRRRVSDKVCVTFSCLCIQLSTHSIFQWYHHPSLNNNHAISKFQFAGVEASSVQHFFFNLAARKCRRVFFLVYYVILRKGQSFSSINFLTFWSHKNQNEMNLLETTYRVVLKDRDSQIWLCL